MKVLVVILLTLVGVFFLGFSAAWADVSGTNDTAAILADIGVPSAAPLTEAQMGEVRGQATPSFITKYVMVQIPIIALNALDKIPGATTANPLNYTYGYWGGLNWTNGGQSGAATGCPTADAMDGLFKTHDLTRPSDPAKADGTLLQSLLKLPNNLTVWGSTYVANPTGLPSGSTVGVSSLSATIRLLGNGLGGIYLTYQNMPYSEYARREAVGAFKAMVGVDMLGAAFKNAFVR